MPKSRLKNSPKILKKSRKVIKMLKIIKITKEAKKKKIKKIYIKVKLEVSKKENNTSYAVFRPLLVLKKVI